MRKIFAYSLIAMLVGVGLVALIETEPGYVLISYGHTTIETSVWVGIVLIAIFVLLLYGAVRLIHFLLAGPSSVSNWLGGRRARNASQHTSRGMINYIEGNWSKARSQLLKGADGNEAPLLNYLFAARASYELGETDDMREYLGLAEASDEEAGIAVELTQAELKLDAGQYEQAVATLVRARRNAGKHPHVLDLLCSGYMGLKDWQNLQQLLPEIKKYKVMESAEYQRLEKQVYGQLLESCRDKTGGEAATEALHQQWQKTPNELKRDIAMLQTYVGLLIVVDAHDAAEKVLLRAQKQNWDSGLARLYGYTKSSNPAKQLSNAEGWLASHAGDAQLQLALGRLSCRCELWGKAREYFEASYKLDRSAEVCAEMGRLLAAQGEERPAAGYYREGIVLEETHLPDLPMPDSPTVATLTSSQV
jgi:HemY protein